MSETPEQLRRAAGQSCVAETLARTVNCALFHVMAKSSYDAVVIGGGPGGSTVATLLARAGKRVLVLEKERFPRFHIGESLLPYNREIFEEIGVLGKIEAAGFPTKLGAQFHLGNRSKSLKLVFRNGCFTRESRAFQVERAVFDDILLKHSGESGAEIMEGCAVTRFETRDDGVVVDTVSESGAKQQVYGDFLIDASGRANVTGNQEGLRIIHERLKKVAIFGHFEHVVVDEGPPGADTVIIRLEDKWFWIIPIGRKISVGCVLDQAELAMSNLRPQELFARAVKSSSEMRWRMKDAKPAGSIQVTSDFSYHNRRLIAPRLLRVGDAAGFMDPIFSAGVYLAMYSGRLAARAVMESIDSPSERQRKFEVYEKRIFSAMEYYWVMVEKFYTTPFMELFMQPRPKFNIADAILAILAGELDGGWKLEARRKAFFLLVKLQSTFPVVPTLSFKEPNEPLVQAGENSGTAKSSVRSPQAS